MILRCLEHTTAEPGELARIPDPGLLQTFDIPIMPCSFGVRRYGIMDAPPINMSAPPPLPLELTFQEVVYEEHRMGAQVWCVDRLERCYECQQIVEHGHFALVRYDVWKRRVR